MKIYFFFIKIFFTCEINGLGYDNMANDITKHCIINKKYAANLKILTIDCPFMWDLNPGTHFVHHVKNCTNLEQLCLTIAMNTNPHPKTSTAALTDYIPQYENNNDSNSDHDNNNNNSELQKLRVLKLFYVAINVTTGRLNGTTNHCEINNYNNNYNTQQSIVQMKDFVRRCTEYLSHQFRFSDNYNKIGGNNQKFLEFSIECPYFIPKGYAYFNNMLTHINPNIQNIHLSCNLSEVKHLIKFFGTNKNDFGHLERISLILVCDEGSDVNDVVPIIQLSNHSTKLAQFKSLKLEFICNTVDVVDESKLVAKLVELKDTFTLEALHIQRRCTRLDFIEGTQQFISDITKLTHKTSIKSITLSPINMRREVANHVKFWYMPTFGEFIVPEYDTNNKQITSLLSVSLYNRE